MASQQEEEMRLNAVPPKVAPGGTRYLNVVSVDDSTAPAIQNGDVATVHYKVLKLGKRSYDGEYYFLLTNYYSAYSVNIVLVLICFSLWWCKIQNNRSFWGR